MRHANFVYGHLNVQQGSQFQYCYGGGFQRLSELGKELPKRLFIEPRAFHHGKVLVQKWCNNEILYPPRLGFLGHRFPACVHQAYGEQRITSDSRHDLVW
jgi:hypothetical protein